MFSLIYARNREMYGMSRFADLHAISRIISLFFFLLASTRIVDSVTAGEVDRCSLPLPGGGGGREEEKEDIRFLASYGFRGNRKKNRSLADELKSRACF